MLTFRLKLPRTGLVLCSLLLCLCSGVSSASGTEFDFGTLTVSSLKLLGDAHLSNGTVMLTRDLPVPNSGVGKVMYSQPIRFRRPGARAATSFSTFFSFSITNLNPSSIGGGLAFVISADDESLGPAGGSLGLDPRKRFVAIEFDTLMDVEFEDVNGNHVGLDLNSSISFQVVDLDTVDIDLKSGNSINSWVDYNGAARLMNISVSYSNFKPKSPILSIPLDLEHFVDDFMYVGFSGSTEGSTEIHNIEWWSFSSSFGSSSTKFRSHIAQPPTSHLMNPTANSVRSRPPAQPPAGSVPISSTQHRGSKSSSCHNELCKQGPGAVVGVVVAGAFFVALFGGVLVWVYNKKFRRVKESGDFPSVLFKTPKEFSYRELKSATKSFNPSRIIGYGAFGTVYKGIISTTGDFVAVKRCTHSSQGQSEFLSELSIIGTLRHRNLVRLQGWCHERGEIFLVYDFMPNGSLDKALFESRTPLPWPLRRKILLGIASALAYLHRECENQVIHRDVKTSNVMLDEGFNARLGDFGLARLVEHDKSPDPTVAAGTMGYLAPEYLITGKATEKTDVFSYGAVVLEVATGRRPIEKDANERNPKGGVKSTLVEWVWGLHGEGRVVAAADPRLEGEFDEAEMREVLTVGLACSSPYPAARPTMRSVVQILVGEAELPAVPTARPCLSYSTSQLMLTLQDSVSDLNEMVPKSSSLSSSSSSGDEENRRFIGGDDGLV